IVKESSRASISASVFGIIIPFALGFALGEFLPDAMIPDPSKRLITSLFLGTALSIASVKIVATVVREMNFLRRTVGQVILGAAGLSADLVAVLKDPHLLLLTLGLIAIATIGKYAGAFLGGELGGLSRREALALATGMNARGSSEVIVATIGLSMGALSQDLFTMIVTMAIVTTLAMPPTLRWALARLPIRAEERERLEREEMEARGFVSKLERLLVAVDDSANGQFGSRVAGMIAGTHSMPTTVMHITAAKKTPHKTSHGEKPDKAERDEGRERAEAAAQLLKDAAEQMKRRRPKDQ